MEEKRKLLLCKFSLFVCMSIKLEMNRIKYWKLHFMHNWVVRRKNWKIQHSIFPYLICHFAQFLHIKLNWSIISAHNHRHHQLRVRNSISIEILHNFLLLENLKSVIDFICEVSVGRILTALSHVHIYFFYYVSNVTDSDWISPFLFYSEAKIVLNFISTTVETQHRGEKAGGNCVKIGKIRSQ